MCLSFSDCPVCSTRPAGTANTLLCFCLRKFSFLTQVFCFCSFLSSPVYHFFCAGNPHCGSHNWLSFEFVCVVLTLHFCVAISGNLFLPSLARRRYLVLGRPGYRAAGLYFTMRHLLRTKEGSAILCIVVVGLQCYAWIPVIVKNEKRRTVTTHKRLLFANRPTQINATAVTWD